LSTERPRRYCHIVDVTPGPLQYAYGDMDSDGDIDLADLLKIQQLILP
jgi:hypothetical protein